MFIRTCHALLLILALFPATLGCSGDSPTPPADSPALHCQGGQLASAFILIDEAANGGVAVSQGDLANCLEAAIDESLEGAGYEVLKTRTETVRRLAGDTPESDLALSLVHADAVDSYARTMGRIGGDTQQGYANFDALLEATEKQGTAGAHELVQTWYSRTREEQLIAGDFAVESEGHMMLPASVHAIAGASWPDAVAERLGRQVIIHNALLRPECKEDPTQHSGDTLAPTLASDDLVLADHRKLLMRVPGTRECTAVALAWNSTQAQFVDGIQPATLHTCEGRVVTAGGEPPSILRLDSCRPETERTDRLQRKRRCTVCGTRDDKKVCHNSFGRNDKHGTALARETVCADLLKFDEDPARCPAFVKLDSRCGPNKEEFPTARDQALDEQPQPANADNGAN